MRYDSGNYSDDENFCHLCIICVKFTRHESRNNYSIRQAIKYQDFINHNIDNWLS